MAKTFSYRRQDVVQALPVKDFKERWPALFEPTQIKEEFRKIATVALESTFIQKLDEYTPKLLDLFKSKGGAVKCNTIQERRDIVICGLVIYLGERVEELISEYKDAEDTMIREDLVQHVMMKVFTGKDLPQNIEHGICIEGAEVLAGVRSVTVMYLAFGPHLWLKSKVPQRTEIYL